MKVKSTPGPAAAGLRQTIEGFGKLRLRVGFFETARYEDGTPVAYVATIHEYGAPQRGIPPRPFMRPTQQAQQDNWNAGFASGARAVVEGRRTPEQVLGAIGGNAAGEISATIAAISSPPLKEATIRDKQRQYAKKGGVGNLAKPLVRTGILIASPTFEVDEK